MRRSLRRSGVNVTFFFFQDIITAALGIILFISLILALRIDPEAKASSTATEVSNRASQLEKQLQQILNDVSNSRKELEKLRESVGSTVDPKMLARQVELLKLQAVELQAGINAAGPVTVTENSRDIDNALKPAKEELRKLKAESEKINGDAGAVAAEVAELQEQLKGLEAELLAQEQLKNRIWLIPQSGGGGKEPLLVTVNGDDIELQRFGKRDEKKVFSGGGSARQLAEALKGFSKSEYYVVLYFKPSALSKYDSVKNAVSLQGFDVGTDLISEDTVLDFSPPEQ